jgi:hypothetical protein
MARRPETARLGRVRQLRQHHGHVARPPDRVRVGLGALRPSVPVGHQAGPRRRRDMLCCRRSSWMIPKIEGFS